MNGRWVRRILIAVAVLVVLAVAGVAVLVATFDANRYKGVAIDWVKTRLNRTLAIDGPIGLSVFPRLQITLSKLTLSEHGSPERFASIDEAGLALELMPLLAKQVVVDQLLAKGVSMRLVRDAKGVRNIDDLLSPSGAAPSTPASAATPAGGAGGIAFDVSSVKLENVRVSVRDDVAKIAGDATLKSLTTGRLSNRGQSPVSLDAQIAFTQPAVAGSLSGKTLLALDLPADSIRLNDTALVWKGDAFTVKAIDASIDGSIAWDGKAVAAENLALAFGATLGELKLAGSTVKLKSFRFDPDRQQLKLDALKVAVSGTQGADPLKLLLDWPQLEADAKSLKGGPLSGSVGLAGANKVDGTFRSGAPSGSFDQLKVPGLTLDVAGSMGPRSVKATVATELTWRGNQKLIALDGLNLQANVNEPNLKPLAITARGNASAGPEKAAWKLDGSLNDNRFGIDGNASFGTGVPFVKAQAKFDALDLNRVLAPARAASQPAPSGPAPADTPVKLEALKSLNGQFAFDAGQLAFQQYRVADAHVDAALDGGVMRIGKLAGKAWGGAVDASGVADAKANRVAVKLAASGVNVNALLKDVAGKDLLDGTGRVTADVSATGRTVGELRSKLGGTAALQLRDGAIKGYNIAKGLRQAKAALSMKQDAVEKANQTEKTDFSELNMTARIADGVARSDDLDLKSPYLRVGGAGAVDIGRGRIDYVAKATVTDTSKGQGGSDLAALRGVTVPVALTGPFEAIDWKIQWSAVAAAAVQNQLKDKLSEKLGEKLGVQPARPGASAPQSPKDAVRDKLKDKLLKGLIK